MGPKDASKHVRLNVGLEFEKFHKRFTCDGEDISPLITIGGLTSPVMAMIMDDPDAPGGTFVHWVIWNIPPMGRYPSRYLKLKCRPSFPGLSKARTLAER